MVVTHPGRGGPIQGNPRRGGPIQGGAWPRDLNTELLEHWAVRCLVDGRNHFVLVCMPYIPLVHDSCSERAGRGMHAQQFKLHSMWVICNSEAQFRGGGSSIIVSVAVALTTCTNGNDDGWCYDDGLDTSSGIGVVRLCSSIS